MEERSVHLLPDRLGVEMPAVRTVPAMPLLLMLTLRECDLSLCAYNMIAPLCFMIRNSSLLYPEDFLKHMNEVPIAISHRIFAAIIAEFESHPYLIAAYLR